MVDGAHANPVRHPAVTQEEASYRIAAEPTLASCAICRHSDGAGSGAVVTGLILPTELSGYFIAITARGSRMCSTHAARMMGRPSTTIQRIVTGHHKGGN